MKVCSCCKISKPVTDYYKQGIKTGICKQCCKQKQKDYSKKPYVVIRQKAMHFYRYGISQTEYDAFIEAHEGRCAICNCQTKKFYIDHDHKCCSKPPICGNCIRGLLCLKCNAMLGMADDDITILQTAINYLKYYQSLNKVAPVTVVTSQ